VRNSTFFPDRDRWVAATRELLRLCEALGDRGGATYQLFESWSHDPSLTEGEKAALMTLVMDRCREIGNQELLGQALFFQGWELVDAGHFAEGSACFGLAREAFVGQPYGCYHACLDATLEFERLAGGGLDRARNVIWSAYCDGFRVDGDRLAFTYQPGARSESKRPEDQSIKCNCRPSGFSLLWWVGWLPHTGPPVGHEEALNTPSLTGHPTRTRVWVEADDACVETPSGQYEGCLLVRAKVEVPEHADAESLSRDPNVQLYGEHLAWFARGVGPVDYRTERLDGVLVHVLLNNVDCPERREEWVPLVVGTRWEYVPAKRPKGVDALTVCQLTHLDDEGQGYIAVTKWANRHER
jgi:hypothetical protein